MEYTNGMQKWKLTETLNKIISTIEGASWWKICLNEYWLRIPINDCNDSSKFECVVGTLRALVCGQTIQIRGFRIKIQHAHDKLFVETYSNNSGGHWKLWWADIARPAILYTPGGLKHKKLLLRYTMANNPVQISPNVHIYGWVSGRSTNPDSVSHTWSFIIPLPIQTLKKATVLLLPPHKPDHTHNHAHSTYTASSNTNGETRLNQSFTQGWITRTHFSRPTFHNLTRYSHHSNHQNHVHTLNGDQNTLYSVRPILTLLKPSSRLVMLVEEHSHYPDHLPSRYTNNRSEMETVYSSSSPEDRTSSSADSELQSSSKPSKCYSFIQTEDGHPVYMDGASISPVNHAEMDFPDIRPYDLFIPQSPGHDGKVLNRLCHESTTFSPLQVFTLEQLDVISSGERIPPPWLVKSDQRSKRNSNHIKEPTTDRSWNTIGTMDSSQVDNSLPSSPLKQFSCSGSSMDSTPKHRNVLLTELLAELNAFAELVLLPTSSWKLDKHGIGLVDESERILEKLTVLCEDEEEQEEEEKVINSTDGRAMLSKQRSHLKTAISAISHPLPMSCRINSPSRLLVCQFELLSELKHLKNAQYKMDMINEHQISRLADVISTILHTLDSSVCTTRIQQQAESDDCRFTIQILLFLKDILQGNPLVENALHMGDNERFATIRLNLARQMGRLEQMIDNNCDLVAEWLQINACPEFPLSLDQAEDYETRIDSLCKDLAHYLSMASSVQNWQKIFETIGLREDTEHCSNQSSQSAWVPALQNIPLFESSVESTECELRSSWHEFFNKCRVETEYLDRYLKESSTNLTQSSHLPARVNTLELLMDYFNEELECWRNEVRFLNTQYSRLQTWVDQLSTSPPGMWSLVQEQTGRMRRIYQEAMQRAVQLEFRRTICTLPNGLFTIIPRLIESIRTLEVQLSVEGSPHQSINFELQLRQIQHQLSVECEFLSFLKDETTSNWIHMWFERLERVYEDAMSSILRRWKVKYEKEELARAYDTWLHRAEDVLDKADDFTIPLMILEDDELLTNLWLLLLDFEIITENERHMTDIMINQREPERFHLRQHIEDVADEMNQKVSTVLSLCGGQPNLITKLFYMLEQCSRDDILMIPPPEMHGKWRTLGGSEKNELLHYFLELRTCHHHCLRRLRLTRRAINVAGEYYFDGAEDDQQMVRQWADSMSFRRDALCELAHGLDRIALAVELVERERFPISRLDCLPTILEQKELLNREQLFVETLHYALDAMRIERRTIRESLIACDPLHSSQLFDEITKILDNLDRLLSQMCQDPDLGLTNDLALPCDKFTMYIQQRRDRVEEMLAIGELTMGMQWEHSSWTGVEKRPIFNNHCDRRKRIALLLSDCEQLKLNMIPLIVPIYGGGCTWTSVGLTSQNLHPNKHQEELIDWHQELDRLEHLLTEQLNDVDSDLREEKKPWRIELLNEPEVTDDLGLVDLEREVRGFMSDLLNKVPNAFVNITDLERKVFGYWLHLLASTSKSPEILASYFNQTRERLQWILTPIPNTGERSRIDWLNQSRLEISGFYLMMVVLRQLITRKFLPITIDPPFWLLYLWRTVEQLTDSLPNCIALSENNHIENLQKYLRSLELGWLESIQTIEQCQGSIRWIDGQLSLMDWLYQNARSIPDQNDESIFIDHPNKELQDVRQELLNFRRSIMLSYQADQLYNHVFALLENDDKYTYWMELEITERRLELIEQGIRDAEKHAYQDVEKIQLALNLIHERIDRISSESRQADDGVHQRIQLATKYLRMVTANFAHLLRLRPKFTCDFGRNGRIFDVQVQLPLGTELTELYWSFDKFKEHCESLKSHIVSLPPTNQSTELEHMGFRTINHSDFMVNEYVNELLQAIISNLPNPKSTYSRLDSLLSMMNKLKDLIGAMSEHCVELDASQQQLCSAIPTLVGTHLDDLIRAVDDIEHVTNAELSTHNTLNSCDPTTQVKKHIKQAGQRLMELETSLERGSDTARILLMFARASDLWTQSNQPTTSKLSIMQRMHRLDADYERSFLSQQLSSAWIRLAKLGDRLGRIQAGLPARTTINSSDDSHRSSLCQVPDQTNSTNVRPISAANGIEVNGSLGSLDTSPGISAESIRQQRLTIRDLLGQHSCVYPECKMIRDELDLCQLSANFEPNQLNEEVRRVFVNLVHFHSRLKKDLIEHESARLTRSINWIGDKSLCAEYETIIQDVRKLERCELPQFKKLQVKATSLENLWSGLTGFVNEEEINLRPLSANGWNSTTTTNGTSSLDLDSIGPMNTGYPTSIAESSSVVLDKQDKMCISKSDQGQSRLTIKSVDDANETGIICPSSNLVNAETDSHVQIDNLTRNPAVTRSKVSGTTDEVTSEQSDQQYGRSRQKKQKKRRRKKLGPITIETDDLGNRKIQPIDIAPVASTGAILPTYEVHVSPPLYERGSYEQMHIDSARTTPNGGTSPEGEKERPDVSASPLANSTPLPDKNMQKIDKSVKEQPLDVTNDQTAISGVFMDSIFSLVDLQRYKSELIEMSGRISQSQATGVDECDPTVFGETNKIDNSWINVDKHEKREQPRNQLTSPNSKDSDQVALCTAEMNSNNIVHPMNLIDTKKSVATQHDEDSAIQHRIGLFSGPVIVSESTSDYPISMISDTSVHPASISGTDEHIPVRKLTEFEDSIESNSVDYLNGIEESSAVKSLTNGGFIKNKAQSPSQQPHNQLEIREYVAVPHTKKPVRNILKAKRRHEDVCPESKVCSFDFNLNGNGEVMHHTRDQCRSILKADDISRETQVIPTGNPYPSNPVESFTGSRDHENGFDVSTGASSTSHSVEIGSDIEFPGAFNGTHLVPYVSKLAINLDHSTKPLIPVDGDPSDAKIPPISESFTSTDIQKNWNSVPDYYRNDANRVPITVINEFIPNTLSPIAGSQHSIHRRLDPLMSNRMCTSEIHQNDWVDDHSLTKSQLDSRSYLKIAFGDPFSDNDDADVLDTNRYHFIENSSQIKDIAHSLSKFIEADNLSRDVCTTPVVFPRQSSDVNPTDGVQKHFRPNAGTQTDDTSNQCGCGFKGFIEHQQPSLSDELNTLNPISVYATPQARYKDKAVQTDAYERELFIVEDRGRAMGISTEKKVEEEEPLYSSQSQRTQEQSGVLTTKDESSIHKPIRAETQKEREQTGAATILTTPRKKITSRVSWCRRHLLPLILLLLGLLVWCILVLPIGCISQSWFSWFACIERTFFWRSIYHPLQTVRHRTPPT